MDCSIFGAAAPRPTPTRAQRSWLVLGAATLACSLSAQAAYFTSTLKMPAVPAAYTKEAPPLALAANDDVLGAPYAYGGFSFNSATFGPYYTSYLTKWSAGSAASVSPVKVLNQAGSPIRAVPLNGRYAIDPSNFYDLASPVRATPLAFDKGYGEMLGVNSDGLVVGFTESTTGEPGIRPFVPVTWRAVGGLAALPVGSAAEGLAAGVNDAGLIVGWVGTRGSNAALQGAYWQNGVLTTLPKVNGEGSRVVGVNNQGQSLIVRFALTCTQAPVPTCVELNARYLLRQPDGTEQTVGVAEGQVVDAIFLGGNGTVVGTIRGPLGKDGLLDPAASRAFISQGGLVQDLTVAVTANRGKLPAGAVLTQALAINERGSIVARMLATDGKTFSIVRLSAR